MLEVKAASSIGEQITSMHMLETKEQKFSSETDASEIFLSEKYLNDVKIGKSKSYFDTGREGLTLLSVSA